MHTRRACLRGALGLGLLALAPALAPGQIPVTDAANLAKNILTSFQTLKSNINEALMIEHQIRGYIQDARHLTTIPMSIIDKVQNLFGDYRNILTNAEGIGYDLQAAQSRFEGLYGTGAQIAGTDFRAMAGDWIAKLKGAGKTAVAAQAVNAQLRDVAAQNRVALGLANSAVGATQVGQAQAQILALMSQQNGALLELQAATGRVSTEFYTQWVAADQVGNAFTDQWMTRDTNAVPAYKPPGQGSGGLPMGKMR